MKRFEAVPNFSEGRDEARLGQIVDAARAVAGVTVLDVERNADHNRAVVSLVGEGAPLSTALLAMVRKATELIDLTQHRGEHPRIGATDVVPFIPLGDATMAEAVDLAVRLGERIWTEVGVPVYLYAAAARRPERADLAEVRRGGFEGLRETVRTDPSRRPDFGNAELHPTAGAVVVGARPVLIAYNVYLTTPDVAVAKKIAKAVRARDGGLPEVKALGFDIRERHQAQVSMNLTDYRTTPVPRAFSAVRAEAEKLGSSVDESEVVGLIPEDALFDAAEAFLQLRHFDRAQVLERKLAAAAAGALRPAAAGPLAALPLPEYVDRLAARTPTPGGGSAAAAVAAYGAALGEMVVRYAAPATEPLPADLDTVRAQLETDRRWFLAQVDADAEAYTRVLSARRALRAAGPTDAASAGTYAAALRGAADVPLATARTARAARERLAAIRGRMKPALASDLDSALLFLDAATVAAVSNVRANLADLRAAGLPVAELEGELARLGGAV